MRPQRASGVVYEEVEGRAVLIDADGRELITLNPVGTLVWQAMDGSRELEQIASLVHEQVDDEVSRSQVEHDVRRFVEELVGEGLAVDG